MSSGFLFLTQRPASGSYWDRVLRCALLKEFASLGFEPARAALYAACARDSESTAVFACTDIVDLDGEGGLAFVARSLGHFLDADAGFRVDDEVMQYFDHHHGEGRAAAVLGLKEDAAIRRYLDGVASTASRGSPARAREPRKTVDEVVSAILAVEESLNWLWFWGRRAPEQELEPVLRLATSSAQKDSAGPRGHRECNLVEDPRWSLCLLRPRRRRADPWGLQRIGSIFT